MKVIGAENEGGWAAWLITQSWTGSQDFWGLDPVLPLTYRVALGPWFSHL